MILSASTGDKIYTDEEYIEALYQLYGDKEGFFDWVEQMEIPGDTKGYNVS